MKRFIISTFTFLIILLSGHELAGSMYAWSQMMEGLEYANISIVVDSGEFKKITTLHAFRIDPEKFRIDVLTADPKESWGESISTIAKRNGAIVATNGGFFTPEHKSIGLLIKSGKKINSHHNTSWWSVFAIKDNRAEIIAGWDAKNLKDYSMAVQAGPRLIVNGRIPTLKKAGSAARTALGITKSGRVILLATEGAGISMEDLAKTMLKNRFEGGLECIDAMGLDGGSSTQIYASVGKLKLSVSGFATVPNGVGIFKK